MRITKTSQEDIVLLKLLISKLEDCFSSYGKDHFSYEVYETSLEDDVLSEESSEDWPGFRVRMFVSEDNFTEVKKTTHPSFKKIKRVRLVFDSIIKEEDSRRLGRRLLESKESSSISISWDHITNVFLIKLDKYTPPSDTSNAKAYGELNSSSMLLNLKYKNRSDAQYAKIRLGKLLSKTKFDKLEEEDIRIRKEMTDIASQMFPDLLDSLILGE